MWLNGDIYSEERSDFIAEANGVRFTKDFLWKGFLEAPEMQSINNLFERADQGIQIMGLESRAQGQIERLLTIASFDRTLRFIEVPHRLSKHKKFRLLSSLGFTKSFNGNKNLDTIYTYIFKNFNCPICSNNVAEIMHMNASAFSRFFKRVHRKTFTRYLNEIRVGYACKLLIEQQKTIASVCHESGFNNISNFNRQFKAIAGMSPTEYVRHHIR